MQSHACGDFDKEQKVEIIVPQGGLESLILGIQVVNEIWLEKFIFVLKPREHSPCLWNWWDTRKLVFCRINPSFIVLLCKENVMRENSFSILVKIADQSTLRGVLKFPEQLPQPGLSAKWAGGQQPFKACGVPHVGLLCDLSQVDRIATYPWDSAKMFPVNTQWQHLLDAGEVFWIPSEGSFLYQNWGLTHFSTWVEPTLPSHRYLTTFQEPQNPQHWFLGKP